MKKIILIYSLAAINIKMAQSAQPGKQQPEMSQQDGFIFIGGEVYFSGLDTDKNGILDWDHVCPDNDRTRAAKGSPALFTTNMNVPKHTQPATGNMETGKLYPVEDPAMFENEKAVLKNKLYRANTNRNAIELVELPGFQTKTMVALENGERLMAIAATYNYLYYASSDNYGKYSIFRYNPDNNEKVQITNKILDHLKFEKNNQGNNYVDKKLLLKANADKLLIWHYGMDIDLGTNYSSNLTEYLVVMDGESNARSASAYYAFRRNGVMEYSGLPGSDHIAFKNNDAIMALYEGKEGKFSKLYRATYDAAKGKYDNFKGYRVSDKYSKVERVFEYNGNVYIVCKIWNQPEATAVSRVLYRFLDNGKIKEAGIIGTGNENDYFGEPLTIGDDIYIKSFNALYKYAVSSDYLQTAVAAQPNVKINTELYKTHDGNVIFYQYQTEGDNGVAKMLYLPLKDKVVSLADLMQNEPGVNANSDPFYSWMETGQCNYVSKFTDKKYVLYKLNFNNSSAEQIDFPKLGKYVFQKILDAQFDKAAQLIWIKAAYEKNGNTEARYFVYDCKAEQ